MKFSKKISKNLAILNYFKLSKKISQNDIFFFFPFYHIGGAEQVHGDILKVFKNENSVCFITNTSKNTAFKTKFNRYNEVIYLGNLIKNPFRKLTLKIISNNINQKKNPVVFSCNSTFFYELVRYLKPHVKVIDLVHAFSENGSEIWSLPVAERINYRVVLGNKTVDDFKKLYAQEGLPKSLDERLVVIRNTVNCPESFEEKQYDKNLKILFVGRNSPEKRVSIIFQIAEICKQKKIPISFDIVGDFSNYTEVIPKNVTLHGEINSKNKLNKFYKDAHLLLITSSREGLPMTILEGMCYGVVPISTDVGEINSIVSENNSTGWLISNSSDEKLIVDNFVQQIEFCVKNTNIVNQFSKKVYLSVKENFSNTKFNDAYKNLFLK